MKLTFLKSILAGLLTAGLLAGCSGERPEAVAADTAELSYTVAVAAPEVWGDISRSPFFKKVEDQTGIHFDWLQFPLSAARQTVEILMSGEHMPDAFYTQNNMTLTQANFYGSQGLLIDLKPLLLEHAPHICQAMDEADAWGQYDSGTGALYVLPNLSYLDPGVNTVYTELIINQKLLRDLGLSMPQTTEELYQVLKAMKGSVAENGEPVIPLSFGPVYHYGDMLRGAFGIVDSTCGPSITDGAYLMYDGESLESIADKDNYRAFLKYMQRLYREGLLDEEICTHDNSMFIAKGLAGQYGAVIDWGGDYILGEEKMKDGTYVGCPVLAGPEGIRLTQNRYAGVRNACDFCITTACEDPVTLIKLCDLFYNEELELGLQHSMGVKDETWHVRDDGMIEYIPEALEKFGGDLNALRASSTEPFGPYYISAETSAKLVPGANAIYKGQIDNELGYNEAAKYPVIPNLSFTEEETEELAILRTDLVEYIKSFEAACITGQKDVDAEWEKHLEKLETLEQTRLVEIYSASLDRYNGVQ